MGGPAGHTAVSAGGLAGSEREARDGVGLKVAYVMSRFPKLSETFVLNEMVALEKQGVTVELYPLLRERGDLVQEGAQPFVARAHYLPFLSWPILRSQALLAPPSPANLPRHPSRHRPRDLRQHQLPRRSARDLSQGDARRPPDESGRSHARSLSLRQPSGRSGPRDPSPRRNPLQLHGARIRPARRAPDALRQGRAKRSSWQPFRRTTGTSSCTNAAPRSPTGWRCCGVASIPPVSARHCVHDQVGRSRSCASGRCTRSRDRPTSSKRVAFSTLRGSRSGARSWGTGLTGECSRSGSLPLG